MAMLKIKKGDTVKVIAGKDCNAEGKVVFDHIALLHNAAWCCVFNGRNYDIAHMRISSRRTAHDTDAQKFLCTGVISDLEI